MDGLAAMNRSSSVMSTRARMILAQASAFQVHNARVIDTAMTMSAMEIPTVKTRRTNARLMSLATTSALACASLTLSARVIASAGIISARDMPTALKISETPVRLMRH